MKLFAAGLVFSMVLLTACTSPQSDNRSTLLMQEIAPTGKLRAAISVGPTGNTFRATISPTTKQPRGVPVDLASALGQKLGVPVELVTYSNYVDLLEAAGRGAWDVTFITFDEERAKVMDFGPAYFLSEFTYLVPAGSAIRNQSEVDRAGVRIAVAEGSVTARNREQSLKSATLHRFKTIAEIRDQVRAGSVDAAAAGRETLAGLATQLPGARVLEGTFNVEGVAIAVPKHHPASLAYVTEFIETAKATGFVRQAFDNAGFKDLAVAPPASRR